MNPSTESTIIAGRLNTIQPATLDKDTDAAAPASAPARRAGAVESGLPHTRLSPAGRPPRPLRSQRLVMPAGRFRRRTATTTMPSRMPTQHFPSTADDRRAPSRPTPSVRPFRLAAAPAIALTSTVGHQPADCRLPALSRPPRPSPRRTAAGAPHTGVLAPLYYYPPTATITPSVPLIPQPRTSSGLSTVRPDLTMPGRHTLVRHSRGCRPPLLPGRTRGSRRLASSPSAMYSQPPDARGPLSPPHELPHHTGPPTQTAPRPWPVPSGPPSGPAGP